MAIDQDLHSPHRTANADIRCAWEHLIPQRCLLRARHRPIRCTVPVFGRTVSGRRVAAGKADQLVRYRYLRSTSSSQHHSPVVDALHQSNDVYRQSRDVQALLQELVTRLMRVSLEGILIEDGQVWLKYNGNNQFACAIVRIDSN